MSKDSVSMQKSLLAYIRWTMKHATVGARSVNWERILEKVPLEKKILAGKVVLENFDLFHDGDHQVIVDSGKCVRFPPISYRDTILDRLDMNSIRLDVELGKIPKEHYNQLLRDQGMSLAGYADARYNPETEQETD